MIRLLELRISNVSLAVLAPVFWLQHESVSVHQKVWASNLPSISSIRTSCLPKSLPLFAPTCNGIQSFALLLTQIKLSGDQSKRLTVRESRSWVRTKEVFIRGRRNQLQPLRLA
jgi:hypothetical protein